MEQVRKAKIVEQIQPNDETFLGHDVPPVPRNYHIFRQEDGRIFTCPPEDKRKSKTRVKVERPKFWLMQNPDNGDLEWVPDGDYNTRPIREFMLRQGLEMEIKFPGMKMTAKAPKCTTIIRQEYGMTGTPLALYMQFCKFRKQKIDPKLAEQALKEGKIK